MSSKSLLAAVAVIAMGTSSQRAEANNEVRAVTVTEDAGTTLVHVRGEQTPTFTVYKLERPSRVVIDMPQARLSEALRGHESASVLTPNTWAVSTIAAQQLDDGGTRVIVSLARPGRYDVKTEGNEVVITVMPRDAAPKTANPAELEKAKAQAQAAEQEAARLRTLAAEQAARAAAAQKTVDEAKKLSAKDLERAKQLAAAANAEAARAKTEAAKAQAEADRARVVAIAQRDAANAEASAAKAQAEEATKKLEAAERAAEVAKREADAAKREALAAKSEAAKAQNEETKKKLAAAQRAAETAQREAETAKREAEMAKREAIAAKSEAAKIQSDEKKLEAAQRAAETAQREAETAKREAIAAKAEAARAQNADTKKKLEAAQRAAEIAQREADAAKREADAAKREAMTAKSETTRANAVAAQAQTQALTAMTDAQNAKAEAARIKQAAEAMRAQADAERLAAANDKQAAEVARAKAEKLMRDAKQQLAQLDAKTAAAQALEDKARTTLAAAEAREEAARESAAQAQKERQIAEAAAKSAQAAAAKSAATDRAKLVADAEAAEARLAKAKRAMQDAEARRVAAEQAASNAKRDLDEQKTALATVEQQRTTAVTAASDAARKRSEAEAAAFDATKKKADAERAAKDADSRRTAAELAAKDADSKRAAAELAAKQADQQRSVAEEAAKAAEKQRAVAESAAKQAINAKRDAEASLAELTAKRQSAEKAAQELATRTKAEAKAQAEMIAAQSRKASNDEIAAAKREVARLADERKRAENDLADRRKAVAQQQAEAARLETVAAQARDAATREESRKTQLAEQRVAEEQELARLKAQKAAAQVAAQVKQQPVQAQLAQVQTRTQAPMPVAKTPNAKVSNVTFKGNNAAGTVELAVSGDANITLGDVTTSRVELLVDHADLAAKLERTLDVSKFGSPVKKVSTFRDRRTPDRVRLVAELASPAIPTVVRDGNTVRWRFASNDVAMRTQNIKPTVIGGFGAASTPVAQQSVSQVPPAAGTRGRRIYHGATVEFDFKDAPIHDLLRIIADTGNVNIVVPDTIDAKVTVRLKRVPWDQALEVILASHGLWYRREGNLYRIATRKEIDAEDEAEAARRAASVAAEAPRPEVVTLNYASADELKPKLEQMLSPKGRIEVDGRTNSLIINDISGSRDQIARLARSLDTQTPQITIEARIVEARSTFVRQFGIQWGGRALAGAAGGNATGLVFPSSIGIVGGNSDQQTIANGITALPSDFAINLPAATGSGEGGAIGMSLGSVGGNFNINLRLSALEDTGTVRIISAPKITVLNNKAALIRQGVSIPISVVSAAGTNTQFVQADLSLEVTPYVSQQDCAIAMNINVTKNEPDFVNVGARGDPTILRKEAKTTMLVNDGETSVLGGIYTRNSGLSYRKVPFLGDLPVLGWLFKNRRENDDRTEILVFITPKITNKASLRCQQ